MHNSITNGTNFTWSRKCTKIYEWKRHDILYFFRIHRPPLSFFLFFAFYRPPSLSLSLPLFAFPSMLMKYIHMQASGIIHFIFIVKSSADFMWISIIYNNSEYFMHIHNTEMNVSLTISLCLPLSPLPPPSSLHLFLS